MNVLIAGATGATGRLLTRELLDRGCTVKAIVRRKGSLPEDLLKHPNLILKEAPLLDLRDGDLEEIVRGCDAIASCLGHTISFRGIYGPPRWLVSDAVRRLCTAAEKTAPAKKVKYVLMNTTGNRNRDCKEPLSLGHILLLGLIRLLVPPHRDNEKAADYLRVRIGQNHNAIEWAAIRPDTLINEKNPSDYDVHPSPIRSAIFNPGKTSRINAACFIADLITLPETWDKWKGQMPVIYNRENEE